MANALTPATAPGAVVPAKSGNTSAFSPPSAFAGDTAMESAFRILGNLSHKSQYELSSSAELLRQCYPRVADALIIELGNGIGVTTAPPATAKDIADFVTEFGEAGRAAVSYWGGTISSNTKTRVGVFNERCARILELLDDDDANAALAWLENLPPSCAVAVLLELST